MATLKTVTIADLVEDYAVYPRRKLDEQHVSDLVQALNAGAALPPVIAEEKTLRLVDGFHRTRAYRRVQGDSGKIKVELRAYAADADLFLDAARLNAGHGRKLARADQIRIAVRASELGVPNEQIATALAVRTDRVEKLQLRIVVTDVGANSSGGRLLVKAPSKPVARHLEGRQITAEQAEAIDHGPGLPAIRLVHDLTKWLHADVLDLTDDKLVDALLELAVLIGERIPVREATA